MAFGVKVEIQVPKDKLGIVLGRLRAGGRPVTPVVQHFAAMIDQRIENNIRVGGIPGWKANRPNTIAAKGHGRILQRSGALRRGVSVTVQASGSESTIQVRVPKHGVYAHFGTKPHTILPRKGKLLWFQVAEDRKVFRARRRKAQARRKAGNRRIKIPSRPGKVWVAAKSVKHPGTQARPLFTFSQGFLDVAWRRPLHDFLFLGQLPGARIATRRMG